MHFSHLDVSHIRNLDTVSIDLGEGLNLFHGENGAGKTALLESVGLVTRGRSFRTSRHAHLIQHGFDLAVVRARLHDDVRGSVSVAISKARSGQTELKIDGIPERRLSRLAELAPVQILLPGISELVFGAPVVRRQFLDWGLFHVEHSYLDSLQRYGRALKQRNAWLRTLSKLPTVDPWVRGLAEAGADVHLARESYIHKLQPVLDGQMAELAPEINLSISYNPGWSSLPTQHDPQPAANPPLSGPRRDERGWIAAGLEKVLGESLSREVKSGVTQAGPHRCDMRLVTSGSPASEVFSRGQGKSVAVGLKVAQAVLLYEELGRSSTFLIDDIGAELDEAHNQRFFTALATTRSQILATATDRVMAANLADTITQSSQWFHVEHGQITADG